jgi:hypothetical protein
MNPASIEALMSRERARRCKIRGNEPKKSRRKSRGDGSTYGPWPHHRRKARRFCAARWKQSAGHLRVADRSAPAFKHLTSMREISQSCGRHAANPRQGCHNDEWHETEPGLSAVIARPGRSRGKYSAEKTQPGKVRREVAMGIAMLRRPGPSSGMSFAIRAAPRHR